jgi:hypothetical protein
MRLGLSSAAAPDLPLADLLEGCRRRGLNALELVLGDAHGLDPEAGPARLEEGRREVEAAGVRLVALACPSPGIAPARTAVRLAARLELPVLLPAAELAAEELGELAAGAGGSARLLLGHGTDPAAVERLCRLVERLPDGTAALAWEVDPAEDDPAAVPAVLAAAGPHLAYVRFRGGGPESAGQSGQGVGVLMARLALSRYQGPLVLTPTTSRYRYAWSAWLGRAGGWGCGSKQADPSLVTLPHAAGA